MDFLFSSLPVYLDCNFLEMEQSNDGVPGTESAQPVGKEKTIHTREFTLHLFIKVCQCYTCRACSGNVSPFEERL